MLNRINQYIHAKIAPFVMRRYLGLLEWQSRAQFKTIRSNIHKIKRKHIVVCSVIRNEKFRLPFFLQYYRELGVDHFLMIDHESTDGTAEYLAQQNDCSSWRVRGFYPPSRAGVVWSNRIIDKYCKGHWVLRLDPDEFLVYPYCNFRNIHELTAHLEHREKKAFYTPLIDCYAENSSICLDEGENIFHKFPYFDKYGYTFAPPYYARGGVRLRLFYLQAQAQNVPVLAKFALIHWVGSPRYLESTHSILPDAFREVHKGSLAIPTGCLLHFKLTGQIFKKAATELNRKQTFGGGTEFEALTKTVATQYFTEGISKRYVDWKSLESSGLLTAGHWR